MPPGYLFRPRGHVARGCHRFTEYVVGHYGDGVAARVRTEYVVGHHGDAVAARVRTEYVVGHHGIGDALVASFGWSVSSRPVFRTRWTP